MLEFTRIGNIVVVIGHFVTNANKEYGIVIPEEFRPKSTSVFKGTSSFAKERFSSGSMYIYPNGRLKHSDEISENLILNAKSIYIAKN